MSPKDRAHDPKRKPLTSNDLWAKSLGLEDDEPADSHWEPNNTEMNRGNGR
jgi:hypothetical protein